jgi:hypothetical protein
MHATVGFIKPDHAIGEGEEGVIAAHADIVSRTVASAPLPNQNIASEDGFTAELFHAESFTNAIASVTNATLTFFMCHECIPSLRLN